MIFKEFELNIIIPALGFYNHGLNTDIITSHYTDITSNIPIPTNKNGDIESNMSVPRNQDKDIGSNMCVSTSWNEHIESDNQRIMPFLTDLSIITWFGKLMRQICRLRRLGFGLKFKV